MSSLRGFLWWRLAIVCCFLGFVSAAARADSSPRSPGRILAAQVHGTVSAVRTDGTNRPLKTGDQIAQDWTVNTAPGASVVLVFSNGAIVEVGGDSSLAVREYLQESFADDYKVSAATEEPSTSTTRLRLIRGELVGNVKHLRLDRGSSFTIDTAVGAAGIRGTVFRIVVRADAAGKAVFSLSTDQGEVVLQGINAPAVSVAAGREVRLSFEGTVDATTGEITLTAPITIENSTEPISEDSQSAIRNAQQQIVNAVETVTIPSNPPGGGTKPSLKNTNPLQKTDSNLLKQPLLPPTSNDH